MGLARVVTCAFDLKSTSCKTGENDRSMISSSLGWLCRQSGGESREKNFSKKLKNFLSIFHPLWRISHLLYIERDTEPLRLKNFSKFFHRFWRFDPAALRLTKTSWVEREWPSENLFSNKCPVSTWFGLVSLSHGKREPKARYSVSRRWGRARVVTCVHLKSRV